MKRNRDNFNTPGESQRTLRQDPPAFRPGWPADRRHVIVERAVLGNHVPSIFRVFLEPRAFPFAWKT